MSILLDGTLAGRLTDALVAADLPYPLTIVRQESDGDIFNPTLSDVPHACTGWVDDYAERDIDGTLIRQTDRKAYVLASSIDIEPATTDRLVVNGVTYTIISTSIDPVGTAYVLQART